MKHKSRVYFFAILLIVFTGIFYTINAAPGDLDTTFAFTGFVKETVGGSRTDKIFGTAIQPDGKIVAAGTVGYGFNTACGIVRYNTNGSFDTTFDGDGKVIGEIGSSFTCFGVALQSDGKIIAAGYFTNTFNASDFAVIRLHPNGSLDTSFDGDGKVTADFSGANDYAYAVAVQPDGRIIVAGRTNTAGDDFAVARFNPDGSPDISFDGDGKLTMDILGGADASRTIAVQTDGKIIIAGNSSVNAFGATNDFSLVRLHSNGSLDTSFDGDGKVTTDILTGLHDNTNAVAIQPDGKIIAVGQSLTINNIWNISLARYNPDGSLDSSFDNDGKLTTTILNYHNIASAVSIQPDGKIVAVGSTSTVAEVFFAALRFNSNGSPDTSFDDDGKVMTFFDGGEAAAYSVAIQADGKIAAAGYSRESIFELTEKFSIARYNPNGSLDTSFDGDGKTVNGIGSGITSARATGIQADGKIVVAGYGSNGFNNDFAVVRYHPNGLLDSSFDGDGKVLTDFSDTADLATCLAIQPDGKIIVGGGDSNGLALARYNPNGSLDTSFDGDGKITGDELLIIYAVAIQADGKIVAAGYGYNGANTDFGIVRWHPNGSLDTSFDGDGKVLTDFSGNSDGALAMSIQTDGKIIAAGNRTDDDTNDFALVRYNTDGSLDTSFDGDGKVATDFSGKRDTLGGLTLQADNKIVAVGSYSNSSNDDFAIARYNPDGSLDTSFDGDGRVTTSLSIFYDHATAVAVQTDGKIITAGNTDLGISEDFALVRYNTNGSLDNSYGTGGKAIFNLNRVERVFGLALDSIGRAVVAGNLGSVFAVAKVVGDIAPPAVVVSVSGRVLRANGGGIFNGFVTLTDSAGNTRIARTNPFGYYRFNEVPGGMTTLSVSSKNFTFADPTRIINLSDNIGNVDFTATE